MRFSIRPLPGLVLCSLLAACSSTPSPAPPALPAPTLSQDDIDGVYRGTSTRFQADSRACPSPGLVVLRVVGGQFEYRWNGRTKVEATIAPDGTVQGSLDSIMLTGRMGGDKIEGDITNGACAYHFRAVKRSR